MVLIIRNNRILTSRHSRIKRLFSCMRKDQQKVNQKESSPDQNKDQGAIMTFVAVLGKLFIYSMAMFTLPFVAFFGVQHIMKVEFHVDRFVTNCISVFAAVITVNLIIAYYVYQALHEPDNTNDQPSADDLNDKID